MSHCTVIAKEHNCSGVSLRAKSDPQKVCETPMHAVFLLLYSSSIASRFHSLVRYPSVFSPFLLHLALHFLSCHAHPTQGIPCMFDCGLLEVGRAPLMPWFCSEPPRPADAFGMVEDGRELLTTFGKPCGIRTGNLTTADRPR